MEKETIDAQARIREISNGIFDDAQALYLKATGDDERLSQETDFPLEVFPLPIREIILETWRGLAFPIDYSAGSVLAAVSIAAGSLINLQFKRGFQAWGNIFLALVGPPGSSKSHPMKFFMRPLIEFDNQLMRKSRDAVKQYRELSALSPKQRQEMGLPPTPPEEPIVEHLIVQDVTQSAIRKVMSENPRGIGLYMDELTAWVNNFNRFTNGGSDEQFWLSAFSNQWSQSIRKTELLPDAADTPVVSVLGSIQDDILCDLNKGQKKANGFFDRILFAYPKLSQLTRWSLDEIGEEVESDWSNLLQKLLQLPVPLDEHNRVIPITLKPTPEAQLLLVQWQHSAVDRCDVFCPAKGNTIKLMTYSLRFCILLHIMRWMCGECELGLVDANVVRDVIRLISYFEKTAAQATGHILTQGLSYEKRELYELLPATFTRKEAVELAEREQLMLDVRTIERFLSETQGTLLLRVRQGCYRKIY